MVNPHTSDPFGPVIAGLAFVVVTPALVGLAPDELPMTLTTTPLWQAVSAVILLGLVSLIAFWIVSRTSVRIAAAGGGDE
jgi:hypothetical protein